VKRFIAFLVMVGMLFTVGAATVGCKKDTKTEKTTEKKVEEKKSSETK
jgi:hypothetical protein